MKKRGSHYFLKIEKNDFLNYKKIKILRNLSEISCFRGTFVGYIKNVAIKLKF